MKEPEALQQVDRTYVIHRGRRLIYFAGCDYHRLASDPRVVKAAQATLRRCGLNVAASRITTGNHKIYEELERKLASFFNRQAATLVSSGYVAPLAAAQALAGEVEHALIDERAHGCLFDALKFLDCGWSTFRHRDTADLRRAVRAHKSRANLLLLSDGMFSHNGSVPPLTEYLRVLPTKSRLLIDESHSAGVLGWSGRGVIDLFGVDPRRVIQTVTLSKAFGAYGGVVLGTRELREQIFSKARIFVGNTPLPLPLAGASLASLRAFTPRLSRRLEAYNEQVKSALRSEGLPVTHTPGPIIAFPPQPEEENRRISRTLIRAGIYPSLIRYLGSQKQGYYRFVLSSQHTPDQLDRLVEALISCFSPTGRTGAESTASH